MWPQLVAPRLRPAASTWPGRAAADSGLPCWSWRPARIRSRAPSAARDATGWARIGDPDLGPDYDVALVPESNVVSGHSTFGCARCQVRRGWGRAGWVPGPSCWAATDAPAHGHFSHPHPLPARGDRGRSSSSSRTPGRAALRMSWSGAGPGRRARLPCAGRALRGGAAQSVEVPAGENSTTLGPGARHRLPGDRDRSLPLSGPRRSAVSQGLHARRRAQPCPASPAAEDWGRGTVSRSRPAPESPLLPSPVGLTRGWDAVGLRPAQVAQERSPLRRPPSRTQPRHTFRRSCSAAARAAATPSLPGPDLGARWCPLGRVGRRRKRRQGAR